MYKPFHLIGLELNISILSAALLGKATGSTKTAGDVVATAKRQLKLEKFWMVRVGIRYGASSTQLTALCRWMDYQ